MPNAETHLAAACDLLAEPELIHAHRWLEGDASRAAFLTGAISPDVRAISGDTREATHFFTIPPNDERSACQVMLAAWPQVGAAESLSPAQAAFVAGYMTHLIMDQTWVERIVMPRLFIAGTRWGVHHPNWRLYCILMTYMEYRAADRLPPDTTGTMGRSRPDGWLPFVADHHLAAWRDRVAWLVAEGGPKLVSSALADSCGLGPAHMEAIVLSEDAMAGQAYPVVARAELAAFEDVTMRRCRDQVTRYLAGTAGVF